MEGICKFHNYLSVQEGITFYQTRYQSKSWIYLDAILKIESLSFPKSTAPRKGTFSILCLKKFGVFSWKSLKNLFWSSLFLNVLPLMKCSYNRNKWKSAGDKSKSLEDMEEPPIQAINNFFGLLGCSRWNGMWLHFYDIKI